jgi:hypothetical protein
MKPPFFQFMLRQILCELIALQSICQAPWPSWHGIAFKVSIVSFVEKVARAGTTDFVPASERIANIDNDGTLWCENPLCFQAA